VKAAKLKELEVAKNKLEGIKVEAAAARKKIKEETERVTNEFDNRIKSLKQTEVEAAGDARKKKFAQSVETSAWAKFRGYNADAAAQIRRGKSNKDKLAEAAAAIAKEDEKPKEKSGDEEKKP
jgi:hypothetical protein